MKTKTRSLETTLAERGLHYRAYHQRAYTKGVADHPEPRGGRTIVRIFDADKNLLAEAEARCNSKLDQYNKRLGREIALGRALKKLG